MTRHFVVFLFSDTVLFNHIKVSFNQTEGSEGFSFRVIFKSSSRFYGPLLQAKLETTVYTFYDPLDYCQPPPPHYRQLT